MKKNKLIMIFLRIFVILCMFVTCISNGIYVNGLNPDEKLINLALNKTATASSQWNDSKSAQMAVDGIISGDSRWVSKYVNGVEKAEWIKIDLGAVYTIDEVRVNFEAAYASEFTIQGSLDDTNYFCIKEVTDGIKGENIYTELGQQKARFIKLDLTKQGREDKKYGFSIYEVEVYDYTQTEKIDMSAKNWADYVESIPPKISADGKSLLLPKIDSDTYEISLFGSDNQQVVSMDGNIIQPIHDMNVNLLYKIQNKNDENDFATTSKDVSILIPGKYQIESDENEKPKVIPGLREWKGSHGDFQLVEDSKIIVNDTALMDIAKTIQTYFADMLKIDISISSGTPVKGDIVLILDTSKKELGAEGYYLQVNDYIEIIAPKCKGVLYGGISITQILYQNLSQLTIPMGIARDYPKYEVRSGMIDVGRVYVPLEYLEEITVYMSWFKLNEIHVHVNDYWGSSGYSAFRLESDVYPEIVSKDGYYTKDGYRKYQKEMLKYGVDVITEIDTPYHAESFRAIEGVKMLKKGALDIRDPFSYTVIENLIDEYLDGPDPVIISDNFHIGTDEYDQEYSEEMRAWTDHFINYVNNKGKKSRLWGSLGEGTAPNGFVGETPVSNEATMNIWAPYWSDVKEMYNAGYDIINTCGGWLYIVPTGNAGYPDRLNIKDLYDKFDVNNFEPDRQVGKGSAVMPVAHPQTKGAEFAIWNDNTSFNIGLSEFDLFDRIKDAVLITSEKTWYGEKTAGQTSDEFMQRVDILSNKVPVVNPNRYVSSKGDTIVEYSGQYVSENKLIDISDNKNDAILHNTTIRGGAIEFNGDSSYMEVPIQSIGYPYSVSMDLIVNDYQEDSVLFTGKDGTFYANIDGTEKLGFERLHGRFIFDYKLPKGKAINITLVSDNNDLYLYVDGVLVSNGILIEKPIKDKEQKSSTFILPCEEVFKNMKVSLKHFKIYNYAMSKDEIANQYNVKGYRENLALNKNVEASSNAKNLLPSLVVDGNSSTRWGSNYTNGVEKPEWLIIDLEDTYLINEIYISWEAAYASGYTIQGSIDGNIYFDIKEITNGTGALDVLTELGDQEVRYVKFALTTQGRADKKYGFSIWEIEIYENPNTQAKRVVSSALEELQQYTRGYEKGNFPVDIYDEWKTIFEEYYALADEGKLTEFQKVTIITDVLNKLDDIENVLLKEALVDKESLKNSYEQARSIEKGNYTDESYQVLQESLGVAKIILDNPASSQNEVNQALEALNAAVEELELIETNKVALQIAVATANTLKDQGALDDVVPAVAAEFESVLDNAKTVLANTSANQTTVDSAFYRLANAIHMLGFIKGDKTALEALIQEAEKYEEGNYTADSWQAFKEAIETAKDVMNDENALESDVEEAYNNLKDSIGNLVLQADKSRLQALYDMVNGLDKSLYTEASVAKLTDPMASAQAVLANTDATQEEVDSAYEVLTRAYLDLRLIPNKDLLQELIDKAQTLSAVNYTAKTWSVMTNALEEATAVLNDPEATQAKVDAVKDVLTKAIAGLETNSVDSNTVVTPVKTGDTISLLYPFAGLALASIAFYGSKKKKKTK